MPTESLARAFFDNLLAGDRIANIRKLINANPPVQECDWFDVKCENPKQRDEKNTRKIWSEALGGFANNQGGVLIWGLDARKTQIDGQEIDCICGEAPILAPEAFRSKLTEWQRQATDPILPNVETVAVSLPEDATKGFIVCFIPEGVHKPYRSEYADRNYYLRAGDNTVVMSRSVLASMFYPKSKAVFCVRALMRYSHVPNQRLPDGGFVAQLVLQVDLENVGTATAKNTTVWVKPQLTGVVEEPTINVDYQWLRGSYGGQHELRVKDISIHPGQALRSFTCAWKVREAPGPDFRVIPTCQEPRFDITVFCDNQAQQLIRPRFNGKELIDTHETHWSGCAEE